MRFRYTIGATRPADLDPVDDTTATTAAHESFMASVQSDLDRTREAVARIRGRGGRVVFIRCPSSDGVRDIENKFAPRVAFWDRLIESSGTLGIHFEDYPELREFRCPEWSHLTSEDATEFSRRLMPILERVFLHLTGRSLRD